MTEGVWVRIAAGCAIVLALTGLPLELLPFASTAPMAAIAAFGLAMLVREGALMVAAFFAAGIALAIGIGFVGKIGSSSLREPGHDQHASAKQHKGADCIIAHPPDGAILALQNTDGKAAGHQHRQERAQSLEGTGAAKHRPA